MRSVNVRQQDSANEAVVLLVVWVASPPPRKKQTNQKTSKHVIPIIVKYNGICLNEGGCQAYRSVQSPPKLSTLIIRESLLFFFLSFFLFFSSWVSIFYLFFASLTYITFIHIRFHGIASHRMIYIHMPSRCSSRRNLLLLLLIMLLIYVTNTRLPPLFAHAHASAPAVSAVLSA